MTPSASVTPAASASPSATPSETASSSITPTATASPSETPSPSPTLDPFGLCPGDAGFAVEGFCFVDIKFCSGNNPGRVVAEFAKDGQSLFRMASDVVAAEERLKPLKSQLKNAVQKALNMGCTAPNTCQTPCTCNESNKPYCLDTNEGEKVIERCQDDSDL